LGKLFNTIENTTRLALRPDDSGNGRLLANFSDRRRTPRNEIEIPIFVYGHTPEGEPFYEETSTVAVNAHGGSISIRAAVQLGQRLLVTNKGNAREQACIVVRVNARADGGAEIGFSFTAATPSFWTACDLPPLLYHS